MISNSKAYEVLKGQTQSSLDFAVLCCNAVPALKGYIKALEHGSVKKLPDADYFKGEPNIEQLRGFSQTYKKNLGKLIFINTFSYFEAYFKELIAEIESFHGGREHFEKESLKKQKNNMNSLLNERIRISSNKLRGYKKKAHLLKYRKHIDVLNHTDFRFPSELFSTFGLVELFKNYSDLKAFQIPHVAQYAFGVDFPSEDLEQYHQYRVLRNDIAHGKSREIEFKEAIAMNYFMRNLALKIDQQVVKHFLVIEFI